MDTPKESNTPNANPLKIRRGRVDSVNLYEVKENELDILEKGSTANLQLDFAIFLITLAFSSLLTLCTTTFKYPKLEMFCMLTVVVGFLFGAYLLIAWWKTRESISRTIRTIKNRIQEDPCEEKNKKTSSNITPKATEDPAPKS